ncbi:MAG: 50S ribosome-binding GTPase [Planctomycetia bacterium]|nr:50S ribosome-binding GTPase [Planctomycetia bacterium]
MIPAHEETIAAVASAAGGGARGIVRISGPAALACVRPLFHASSPTTPAEANDPFPSSAPAAVAGELRLAEFHAPVPVDLFIWPTERSYTRRPSVELHVPGSAPIVAAVLAEVCRHGARPARPGEFTLQAFLAGRIDLTQAEAVLGVVDAVDARCLHNALQQMAGGLAEPLRLLRSELLNLIADLEAGLDFVEEDLEFIDRSKLASGLAAARTTVDAMLARMAARGEAGELPRAVLVGRPNAGKSTLFNALAGSERALVSPTAGTTRDYLTCRLTLAGVEVELVDTAGIDNGDEGDDNGMETRSDTLFAASQLATTAQRRNADVVLVCCDGASQAATDVESRTTLFIRTKSDLESAGSTRDSSALEVPSLDVASINVSAATGEGLDALKRAIAEAVVAAQSAHGDVVGTTAVRCRDSLRRAAEALAAASSACRSQSGDEIVAAELRLALDELGQVAGTVYTDDILDRIFSRFCIGK